MCVACVHKCVGEGMAVRENKQLCPRRPFTIESKLVKWKAERQTHLCGKRTKEEQASLHSDTNSSLLLFLLCLSEGKTNH